MCTPLSARLFALSLLISLSSCVKEDPLLKSPFSDNFDRAEIGSNYHNTGAPYQIVGGKLRVKGAYNHPLWLKKRLPKNATIEFDVMSKTPDGDIKVEAWGDGQSFAPTRGAYLATSYVFIFGGWRNSVSALCRLDEHAPDRKMRRDIKVKSDQTYHWKIRRKGRKVEWFIDGKPFLSLDDSSPLKGSNHAYFGFNNYESDLTFDNLRITPH